jgi:Tol biopolymer transport system component
MAGAALLRSTPIVGIAVKAIEEIPVQPPTTYLLAAILFVLGLAAIGGATFGRQRNQRLALAVIGIVLWAATLLLYSRAASTPAAEPTPTPTAILAPTATSAPPPSPTPVPTAPLAVEPPAALANIPGRIAFHSDRSGDLEIWVMNANGSEAQQLTDTPGRDIEPDWSPDGQTIVFSSNRDAEDDSQLYLMDADGGNQRRLMEFIAADQVGGRWSPDGAWIAFFTNVDGTLDIYKVRSDGTELTRLTADASNNFMPDWSPDGQRIVFVSERDRNREIYVMNVDGSNPVRLTDNLADDQRPRWSPDGASILFQSDRDGQNSLYVVDAPAADAAGPIDQTARLLTFPAVLDESPNWALDGTAIVFSSNRDSENLSLPNWEIYLLSADGAEITRLTNSPSLDRFPAWTP